MSGRQKPLICLFEPQDDVVWRLSGTLWPAPDSLPSPAYPSIRSLAEVSGLMCRTAAICIGLQSLCVRVFPTACVGTSRKLKNLRENPREKVVCARTCVCATCMKVSLFHFSVRHSIVRHPVCPSCASNHMLPSAFQWRVTPLTTLLWISAKPLNACVCVCVSVCDCMHPSCCMFAFVWTKSIRVVWAVACVCECMCMSSVCVCVCSRWRSQQRR